MNQMDNTLESKSFFNDGKLLTDNFIKTKQLEEIFQVVNYELKSDERADTDQILYKIDLAEGGNPERMDTNGVSLAKFRWKHVVNDKIKAFNTREKVESKLYFRQTQNWIGHITDIHDRSFTARLDEINNSGTYEVAEFEFDDVSDSDKKLIALGAIFYWSVGHAVRSGQVYKESFIRFQRLPPWNGSELDRVVDQSSDLRSTLKWE